ncbi:SRPBCC family protein [Antrihabitans stalactiti]|uniref:SRPBCC family protein n=1 Tax=Antrihabitans stalactiti TaxID=2584121 RepID=UPI001F0F971E|nr:SRPBCC family protein [Antrihabitans stalactiti]
MPRTFTVSESIDIAADPLTVYAKVSDPTLTRHWSPENRGATMQPSADSANTQVGTVFDGHNERFGFRWTTECVVTAAEPGERFAFEVRAWEFSSLSSRSPSRRGTTRSRRPTAAPG